MIAGAGYGAFYLKSQQSPAIPASVKSATTLPIYYPQKLPESYSLDENSFELRGDVLSYSATSTNNQKLLFTIQPRPATFDFPTFYQQGLSNTEQFSTINGQAAIGLAQKKLVGSMVTGKSWLLLSADNSDLTFEDFKLVLTNLKLSI